MNLGLCGEPHGPIANLCDGCSKQTARVDGLEVVVQEPSRQQEELNCLNHTTREIYEEMEEVQTRILELLFHIGIFLNPLERTIYGVQQYH